MSSLFVEDQKTGLSDISVIFQRLLLRPFDRLHNVTGFPELWQKRRHCNCTLDHAAINNYLGKTTNIEMLVDQHNYAKIGTGLCY